MRILAGSLAVAAAVLLGGCGDDGSTSTGSLPSSATPSESSRAACTYTATGDAARKVDLPPSDPAPTRVVTITTNRGAIKATLDTEAAPCTTGSLTSLAKQRYFDRTTCHRMTTQGIFVLQCGDPTGTGSGGPGYSFADELTGKETYPAGTLAMANAGPDTNGSQFFIVYAETPLDPDYTVFGTIDAKGLRVVKAIARAGTVDGGPDGAPKRPVTITTVR
jgi:peptidyl-prolyl cis-trans isomerase B (cyclophilin B)